MTVPDGVAVKRPTIHAVRPDERAAPPVGAPGVVLGGKYRLEQAIARGGMARVWRATHVTLNRPVAVKFVEAFGANDDERIERFLREAKVAASVRHKNVVDIIDFGTYEDEPYMVMELLEGETLDQRLVRGSMSNDEVVSVALQMLSGLDAVHRAGIVHRDLKPGNVFLTDDHDGVFARLLDFGISQGADEDGASDRMVVGTPEYMSPEQAFGDPLDARSDLYSVGVVLYEMLSGTLPFEDADPQNVVEMVAHGTPPSLELLRPDAPELCAVVARAMARGASERFESARDMRRAILEASGGGPDTTGRHMAIPRDSRVSGTQPRASLPGSSSSPPAAGASSSGGSSSGGSSLGQGGAGAGSSSPTAAALDPAPRRSHPVSDTPPAPAGARVWIAVGAVALVAVTAAIVWAAATRSPGTEVPTVAAPPRLAPAPAPAFEAAAPVPEAAPPVPAATPEAAPAGEAGEAVTALQPATADTAEPATSPEPSSAPGAPARRGGRPRAPTRGDGEPRGGIVRELDF